MRILSNQEWISTKFAGFRDMSDLTSFGLLFHTMHYSFISIHNVLTESILGFNRTRRNLQPDVWNDIEMDGVVPCLSHVCPGIGFNGHSNSPGIETICIFL